MQTLFLPSMTDSSSSMNGCDPRPPVQHESQCQSRWRPWTILFLCVCGGGSVWLGTDQGVFYRFMYKCTEAQEVNDPQGYLFNFKTLILIKYSPHHMISIIILIQQFMNKWAFLLFLIAPCCLLKCACVLIENIGWMDGRTDGKTEDWPELVKARLLTH